MSKTSRANLPVVKAKKLLSKLSQNKFILCLVRNHTSNGEWHLCSSSNKGKTRPVGQISSTLIDKFVSSGVLRLEQDTAYLTRAGHSYIRRTLYNGGEIVGISFIVIESMACASWFGWFVICTFNSIVAR